MKNLINALLLLSLLVSLVSAQVYIEEPKAPPAISWGEDLSQDEEKELLAKIESDQLKRELQEIKKLNEKKYYSLLRKSSFMTLPSIYSVGGSGISIFGESSKEDKLRKEITELEIYSEILGVKYQEADQAEKQKLAVQLRETLSDAFELRETQRKEEIAKLEKKLADLKESIKIRNDNKQQIVDERFRTLTGKSKYLKWD